MPHPRKFRTVECSDALCPWEDCHEQVEPLEADIGPHEGLPGNVPPGAGQALHEPGEVGVADTQLDPLQPVVKRRDVRQIPLIRRAVVIDLPA